MGIAPNHNTSVVQNSSGEGTNISTSAQFLEKLSSYQAIEEIQSWDSQKPNTDSKKTTLSQEGTE